MKIVLSLILSAITVFSLTHCGRLTSDNDPFVSLHPDIKTYFGSYQQGSWWEYEIVDSNQTEKMIMTRGGVSTNVTTNQEIINSSLESDRRPPIGISADQYQTNSFGSVYIINSTFQHTFIHKNDSFVSYSYPNDTVFILDSVELNGHRFKNVLVSKEEYSDLMEVWIAPNVGIIKKVFYNPQKKASVYIIKNFSIK